MCWIQALNGVRMPKNVKKKKQKKNKKKQQPDFAMSLFYSYPFTICEIVVDYEYLSKNLFVRVIVLGNHFENGPSFWVKSWFYSPNATNILWRARPTLPETGPSNSRSVFFSFW